MNYIYPINNNLNQYTVRDTEDANPIAENHADIPEEINLNSSSVSDVKSESLYSRSLLVALKIKSAPKSSGLAACNYEINETCALRQAEPYYPKDGLLPNPARINRSDYANGVTVTWRPESQPGLANCDKSTQNIYAVCHFADGDLTVYPDANGNFIISKKLNEPLSSVAVTCDVYYTNPNDNNSVYSDKSFSIYAPETVNDTQNGCYSYEPVLTGDIIYPSNIFVGDSVTLSYPANMILECDNTTIADPANVSITFMVNNDLYYAFNDNGYFKVDNVTFNSPNKHNVAMLVTLNYAGSSYVSREEIDIYVNNPASTGPLLAIENAPYAAIVGENITFRVENADTENWDYSWNFGSGMRSGAEVVYAYQTTGPKTIRLTATDVNDPFNQHSIEHIITIVPQGNPIPNLQVSPGMGQAPLSVTADASNSYATASGATIVNYSIVWGDNGSQSEQSASPVMQHTYNCYQSSCAYTVNLTVTDSNNKTSTITANVSSWQ